MRYTVDGWHSYTDVAAYYVDSMASSWDLFRFSFRLPYHLSMGSRIAFAVGYADEWPHALVFAFGKRDIVRRDYCSFWLQYLAS